MTFSTATNRYLNRYLNRYRKERMLKMIEKKALSAKRYLMQLEILDENINQALEELHNMKVNMCSAGGIDYSKDRVQTSTAGDSMSRGVINYVTRDEEINAEIDRFADAKRQIVSEIRGLHDVRYIRLLHKVYVQYKSIRQTSKEMKMSYSYVLELHKKALAEFEKTYKNLHYLC